MASNVQFLAQQLVWLDLFEPDRVLSSIEVRSTLVDQIRQRQFEDQQLCDLCDQVFRSETISGIVDPDGILRFDGSLYVPKVGDLIQTIPYEAHCSRYSIHPGAAKTYLDSKQLYWWKWEEITMDFILGLPRTSQGHDSIWLIVDRLTKSAHFIPVSSSYTAERLVQIYLQQIV